MNASGPVAVRGGTGRDLADRADVEVLVTAFYRRAFADPLIGPVFTEVARMDLDAHMPIMCDFWETVLFAAGRYRRNALAPHLALHRMAPLGAEHFGRWLALWTLTVDGLFRGDKAELAKRQAERIAGSLQRRLAGRDASEYVSIRRREGGEAL
ncbi:group III truncated hemoglobin [Actinacidiphila sp. bgisy160]|uniref:group III truncated hemoglobin n=1 Tax=Actinacidiphila sp. bgisy160 TaxID=3413796 RepID=UPI003D71DF5F